MSAPSHLLYARPRRGLCLAVAIMAARLLAGPAVHAQVAPPSGHESESLQERLDQRGLQLGIRYDGETFSDVSGGLRRGGTYLGTMNLQLTLDGHRLIGWPGLTVFLYGLGIHGGHPSTFAGDVQGVTNIEGPAKWPLEEAWIQQTLFEGRFSGLIGRYDLNSEFYRLQSAGLFLNGSFGVGPEFSQSGQEGPSIFPNTSVGARFEVNAARKIVLRTAVLDGVPVDRPGGGQRIFAKGDGLLLVAEAAYLHRPVGAEQRRTRQFRIGRGCCGSYTGKLAVGAWRYTATFDGLADVSPDGRPVRHHGRGGVYLLGDRVMYQDRAHPERRLSLFGELGIGDSRVNRFASYTGGGLTVAGPFPGRAQDELGIAVAAAHNGSPFLAAQRAQGRRERRSEVTLELTYLAQFAAHLAVQPDLQLVVNPNTDPTVRNAVALLLRFELSL